jgi:hypothetical protein
LQGDSFSFLLIEPLRSGSQVAALQEQQCSYCIMQEQDSNIEKERLEGEFMKLKDKMLIVIVLVGNLSMRGGREIKDLV